MKDDMFKIDSSGKLFREGVHVGNVKGDQVEWTDKKFEKHADELEAFIKAKDGDGGGAAPLLDLGGGGAAAGAPAVTTLPSRRSPEDRRKEDVGHMTLEADREMAKAKADLRDDEEFVKANRNVPPVPKKHPEKGDKTPKYVEWLKTYRPDKFAEKYGVTGEGELPVVKTNPETGIEEVVGMRPVTFSQRKTHLTELKKGDADLPEGYSWDA